jgi:hypothetical protein
MVSKVLTRINDRIELRSSYFALGTALTLDDRIVSARTAFTQNLNVKTLSGKDLSSVKADWLHLLPNITAAGGATGLASPAVGQYSNAKLATISGVNVVVGDSIEIRSAEAKKFTPAIAAGLYRCVSLSPVTIELVTPPVYALTSSNEIGGAVYSRTDPNNPLRIEGLGAASMEVDGVVNQTRVGYEVVNAQYFIDGDPKTSGNGATSSFQGVWYNVKLKGVLGLPNAIAFDWRVGSARLSYDTVSQNADFFMYIWPQKDRAGTKVTFPDATTVNASTLQRFTGRVWANSASGISRYYSRPDSPMNWASIQVNDNSGSRAFFYDFTAVIAGVPCQIKLADGTVPEAGSILSISDAAAATFYPAIVGGRFRVITNDNVSAWVIERI